MCFVPSRGVGLSVPNSRFDLTVSFEQDEWILLRGVEVTSGRRVFATTTNNGESARLRRSWELRDELDPDVTLRPLAYEFWDGRHHLVLPDPGGQPLVQLPLPFDIAAALRAAVVLADALTRFHARGFVHRDIKPSAILYNADQGRAWFAGTGLSLRIAGPGRRNEPSESMVGTPAYMAPEQTGRVNWPVDARSDLYALGVTFYELLTGSLPFDDTEPLSLLHAHVARNPEPPHVRRDQIPEALSAVVLRLLAKDPKSRYQTAAGLAHDLHRCLDSWVKSGAVDSFALGERDVSDQIGVPDRIIGREPEVAALVRSLARVTEKRKPGLVLVGGTSGVGKSALVEEALRRTPNVSFSAAKLDAIGRGAPLATFGRALAGLLPELHNDDALAAAVRAATAPQGRLLLNILPELATFFVSEPEPPELPARESHLRFQQVVRGFVRAFARPERPLALFLDDLHWIDPATLAILGALLSDPEMGPLLLVVAYRTNEVDAALLTQLEKSAGESEQLTLRPLELPQATRLIGNMIASTAEDVAPLAELVFAKTAGNPFFTIQLMLSLAEEGLVTFDAARLAWRWELSAVEARGFTDSVVDIMLEKLDRLPSHARSALVHLGCLGDFAPAHVLAAALGMPPHSVHGEMLPSVRAGLVALTTAGYVFLHDRIRESAYATVVDPVARATIHRQIGERLFTANISGTLFDVFRQLDRGVSVAAPGSGVRDATIALAAAREAMAAAAYAAAEACLKAGAARLPGERWTTDYRITFDIELLRAECELFLGALPAAASRLSALAERARAPSERAAVTRHSMNAHVSMGRIDLGLEAGLAYLRGVGLDWPARPTDDDVSAVIARMHTLIGDRAIETLAALPLATDEVARSTLDHVLPDFGAPAIYYDRNLFQYYVVGTVNYAIEHGITEAMAWMFAVAAMSFTTREDDPDTGSRFARVASELAERFPASRFSARAHITLAHHVIPWIDDCRRGDAMAQNARAAMQSGGELIYLGYVNMHMVTHLFANGAPLREVVEEGCGGREVAVSANIPYVAADIDHQLTLVRMLRGQTPTFGTLDAGDFRESDFETSIATRLPTLQARYWIRKLLARYFAGDFGEAVAVADTARPLMWRAGGAFTPHFRENAEYHFFAALARAAVADAQTRRERLEEHRERYRHWSATAPLTYACRLALIDAEYLRLDGGDAGPHYERAITLARRQGYVHNEAISLEVAGRYWASRGYATFAETYYAQARDAYRRWGADGKVQQLEARFPEIRARTSASPAGTTLEQPVDQLDLATALAVSEEVSSEMVHERVVEGLLSRAVRMAGAERAVLLLPHDSGMIAEAEANTRAGGVDVRLGREDPGAASSSEAIVRYVVSTGARLVLEDAAATGPFVGDAYVASHRCRSVACLPLTRRGQLGGVLYLENNLAPRVFTARRLATMSFIASQAAGALENARLYAQLANARMTEQTLYETREALGHLARVATLGELTASIGHEVNQPLTAIRLNAATCVRWLKAGELAEASAAAARVGRDAEQAMEVVERLRSLFKKQRTERGELDLNDAVAEVVALTGSEMAKSQISSDVRLASQNPRVLASRVQIQQVLMNLVLNAIQAMQDVHDRPRRIVLTTELMDDARVRTSVCDSGSGVSKQHVTALFRAFFSTKRDGTGVGLSISQSIVAEHSGDLWHMPNDGHGATFGFDLPTLPQPT